MVLVLQDSVIDSRRCLSVNGPSSDRGTYSPPSYIRHPTNTKQHASTMPERLTCCSCGEVPQGRPAVIDFQRVI